jgi:hypothetical protein
VHSLCVTTRASLAWRPRNYSHDVYSCRINPRQLGDVAVTTLLLHALDDPINAHASVDWAAAARNKNLIAVTTKRGGHLAWEQGAAPGGECWAHAVVADFLASTMEIHASTNFLLDVLHKAGRLRGNLQGGGGGDDAAGTFSPQAMARICSGSDLRAFGPSRAQPRSSGRLSALGADDDSTSVIV